MVLDDEQQDPRSRPADPTQAIDREVLADARRRADLPAVAESERWTACSAPSMQLVVDRDGSLRGCDFGSCSMARPPGSLAEAWQSESLTTLRGYLAAGRLPMAHCRGCATWVKEDLLAQAPMLRDYGAWFVETGRVLPRTLVLRIPLDPAPLAEGVAEALPLALPGIGTLVVEAESLAAAGVVQALATLAAAAPCPQLVLRLARVGALATARGVLGSHAVHEIELTLVARDDGELTAARSLADGLGARLVARFVLTPEHWFEFEEVVRGCAAHGIPLSLRVLDHDGVVPLAALGIDDLAAVKAVVTSCWSRCAGAARPTSLGERAFDQLGAELRKLLRSAAEQALANEASTGVVVPLALPSPEHAWCTDPERRPWWLGNLFGFGHLPAVREWLLRAVGGAAGEAVVRRETWLRVLCQRLAADQRLPELLELLSRVYQDAKGRARLVEADAAFAGEMDLHRFGGPWAKRLGLRNDPPRKRPFPIGKPRQPKATTAAPDITVLIPSFRHAEYIEETLRSVLAQRYGNFRVLVVDDGSPDETVARARTVVDPRLTVRVNETNLGLGNSVLRALETIDTPYVALLNSDDLFHPDRLGRCREVLQEHPEVQLVTTGLSLVDSKGGQLTPANASLVLDGKQVYDWVHWFEHAMPAGELPREAVFPTLLERNFLATSSNLVARTDWLRAQAGALRSLKYCLDWQLFLEAALENALHHLPEPLVAYRLHATNTVWFREGRRWSYYLEVNRVAAEALRRFAGRGSERGEAEVARVLEAIAGHLTVNRETDGFALFLNTAFDALQVDRLAADSPRVQALVQQLNTVAEDVRRARDRAEAGAVAPTAPSEMWRRLLGDLAIEQARIEVDSRRWLQGYADSLEGRLRECWGGREKLEQGIQALRAREAELERKLQDLVVEARRAAEQVKAVQAELQAEGARHAAQTRRATELERDLAGVRADLQSARGEVAASRDLRELITRELVAVRAERDGFSAALADTRQVLAQTEQQRVAAAAAAAELVGVRDRLEQQVQLLTVSNEQRQAELAARQAELAARHAELVDQHSTVAALQAEQARAARSAEELRATMAREQAASKEARDRLAADLAASRAAAAQLERQRQEQAAALAKESAQVHSLGAAKKDLEQQRSQLLHESAQLRAEIEKLGKTREFRTGNFLWNKTPLGYMSRRGKKWYRRLLDAKSRCVMWGSNLFGGRRRKAEGTAVVTACWQWPIYSHTFVYQEMIGLTHMGLDVKLFHWDMGDAGQLHKAFSYLADHRLQLQPIWENHLRDRDHFEKTKPGRLRSFLERVSAATGRKVEDLEKESIVLQGCTFARMAELAGARYLHSYFFYDQSFMAMQAAWLLELPRGVSCYADHMLNDYPWKLVPLHVELCDVIVATSARIKSELSQMTGGKYDAKIIVKPNGVDGARFPPVPRQDRKAGDPFEVVSISRIEPKKGLTHLVEAVAMLKKQGHKIKAHVIGSKDQHSKGSLEYAAEFEQLIQALGVQDEVILHGMKKQEELPPILQRCRAFVAPYVEMGSGDKDGIPTAMLEGLASGLPVITTDSGSILEVVTTEVEGIVVPQRDSKAFAAALERLIKDPALERRMAKAARARFDKDFDIRVTEQRLHERVARLVAPKKAGGAKSAAAKAPAGKNGAR